MVECTVAEGVGGVTRKSALLYRDKERLPSTQTVFQEKAGERGDLEED